MHSILLPKQYPFCVFQKRRRFKKVLGCEAECIFVVGIWCCSIRGLALSYSLPKLLINDGSEYKLMYPNWFWIYVYVPDYIAFHADFKKFFSEIGWAQFLYASLVSGNTGRTDPSLLLTAITTWPNIFVTKVVSITCL